MNKHAAWLLSLALLACAGTHAGEEPTSQAGAGGSTAAGAPHADGGGGGGAKSCMRTPVQHRAEAATCEHDRIASAPETGTSVGCTTDADCKEGTNGRCGPNNRGVRTCNYDECFSDGDCMKGPCICRVDDSSRSNHRCYESSQCKTDADCSQGFCSPSLGTCGHYGGVSAYYCHTCEDECVDDAECRGGYCAYEPTVGHWKCSTSECVG